MKLLLFAGTYEGRKICEFLTTKAVETIVCVATEYGKELIENIPQSKNIKIICKRLEPDEIEALIEKEEIKTIIDATHPFAEIITENLINISNMKNCEYIRVARDTRTSGTFVKTIEHAVEELKNTTGNVLVTTGSKELSKYTQLPNFEKRLFIRVLPTEEVLASAKSLGFLGRNIIAMQGPFSKELNIAMLKQLNCKYLVSKVTGSPGGFEDKISACNELSVKTILIGSPKEENGFSLSEVICLLNERLKHKENPSEYFPLFISSKNKKALIIGGGIISERRIRTLINFMFSITVLSPEITDNIKALIDKNKIIYIKDTFKEKYLKDFHIIIAATNDREVNKKIKILSENKNLFVSIADNKEECNFYFPAVIRKNDLVIGLTNQGKNHKLLRETADIIRRILN